MALLLDDASQLQQQIEGIYFIFLLLQAAPHIQWDSDPHCLMDMYIVDTGEPYSNSSRPSPPLSPQHLLLSFLFSSTGFSSLTSNILADLKSYVYFLLLFVSLPLVCKAGCLHITLQVSKNLTLFKEDTSMHLHH